MDGFIRVAESEKSTGEIINIGNGKGITIGDLARKILELMNCSKKIRADDGRIRPEKSEVMQLICDNAKAKKLLGWSPSFSLDDGLRETISWIEQNKKMYKSDSYNM